VSSDSIYAPIRLLCGNKAYFDFDSGIGHRCATCFAMVGSIGMPKECDMEEVVSKLKGTEAKV